MSALLASQRHGNQVPLDTLQWFTSRTDFQTESSMLGLFNTPEPTNASARAQNCRRAGISQPLSSVRRGHGERRTQQESRSPRLKSRVRCKESRSQRKMCEGREVGERWAVWVEWRILPDEGESSGLQGSQEQLCSDDVMWMYRTRLTTTFDADTANITLEERGERALNWTGLPIEEHILGMSLSSSGVTVVYLIPRIQPGCSVTNAGVAKDSNAAQTTHHS
ncbi:hypothetical protein B0H14DRAFT_2592848 [Mycena olivaceomarginata]|nr:hypothetical protein B0H14DRAFT_2592848 [Mycena olivaceomarginata]